MSRLQSTAWIAWCLLFLAVTLPGAPVTLVYRQVTGSRADRIEIGEEALDDGAVLRMRATSGETYRIQSDWTGSVTSCAFEFPEQGTSWAAHRNGTTLRIEGTIRGRTVSRGISIGDHPWYESAERSLQAFAVSGSPEPRRFWMVEPYGGGAYLMSGRIEGREPVTVNGKPVEAVRVIVRPAGLLSFLWSSTYWYSPTDGTFLRSESVRGIAGLVPLTVIELVEDLRDR